MDSFTQFDGNLLIGIQHALNADWLTPVMKFITLFGEAGIFWILLCLSLIIFRKTRRLGIICAFSLLLTFICCNLILKPLVDRVRPWVTFQMVNAMLPPPGDASFPSGHSANSMGPAWGMIGTLIGLVMMLYHMDDVSTLGPNMAVALLTTFYGSVLANWLCTPVANKLKAINDGEMHVKEIMVEGLLSIQAGENPRVIEEKLKSVLSPDARGNLGSGGEGGDE